jgi:hypothetical protein
MVVMGLEPAKLMALLFGFEPVPGHSVAPRRARIDD